MLRVIEIGLIDGVALALVDRAGVTVAETLIFGAVESDGFAAVVQLDKNPAIFDVAHGAGVAVIEAELLIPLGELDSVAGGEGHAAAGRLEVVIRAKVAEFAANLASACV